MAAETTVKWMRGESGNSGTYTFSPNPTSVTRPYPGQKKAEYVIPNLDGIIIQTYGRDTRRILLIGTIVATPAGFDALMTKKNALENGIATYQGQLHIQSATKHIYYKGILDGQIEWAEQKNLNYLDYKITIVCGDITEYVV